MVIVRAVKIIQEFIKLEAAAGIVLFIFALLAIILDNSVWHGHYITLQHLPVNFNIGAWVFNSSLMHIINDGLMTLFFFLVGLEIKREIIAGELNTLKKFALPGFAALGGMIVPAIIYVVINLHQPVKLIGWAIPTATDIAFALGILSLFGKRIPLSLKVFLTALAILDDLGAIIIIAVFYTEHIAYIFLVLACVCILILLILNLMRVVSLTLYFLIGILLWFCILKSGIHATLAGVITALFIPLKNSAHPNHSPLKITERALHPWVAFLVLPVFAFFNAGISFVGISMQSFSDSLTLGIAVGLFFGKQIGVFAAAWLAVKTKLAKLPTGADWSWIYGIALICGVGFTMSLFIGTLAFEANPLYETLLRLGVISGSVISALVGCLILFFKSRVC